MSPDYVFTAVSLVHVCMCDESSVTDKWQKWDTPVMITLLAAKYETNYIVHVYL